MTCELSSRLILVFGLLCCGSTASACLEHQHRLYATGASGCGFAIDGGDINGDGHVDLVVYTFSHPNAPSATGGVIDVIWGSVADLPAELNLPSPSGITSRIQITTGDDPGLIPLAVRDLDLDNFDDIVIGFPTRLAATNADGRVYIVWGRASFPSNTELTSGELDLTAIHGRAAASGWFGYELCDGSFDSDAVPDIAIAAIGAGVGGEVYIVHGRDSFPVLLDLSVPQPLVTRLIEPEAGWLAGLDLAAASVDLTGGDELLIGAGANSSDRLTGKAVLVRVSSLTVGGTYYLGSPGLEQIGFSTADPTDLLGQRVAIHDVDGDRVPDVLIAAPNGDAQVGQDCGIVYVVFGVPWLRSSWEGELTVDTLSDVTKIVGPGLRSRLGVDMVGADFDADGTNELAVSADKVHNDPSSAPRTYVVDNLTPHPTVSYANDATCRLETGLTNGGFGKRLWNGDLEPDGLPELIVAEPYAENNNQPGAGTVHIYDRESISGADPIILTGARLSSYPNPFAVTTTIGVPLSRVTHLDVYDVRGRAVISIATNTSRSIEWTGRDHRGNTLPSGVYFVRARGAYLAPLRLVLAR